MAIPSAATNLLGDLLPKWHLLLQEWSASGRLTAAAQEALLLNGEPQALTDLTTQWSAGEFEGLPPIVLLSAADINGAMGAYAISTGTIYLNADWLAGATKEQVLAVLTEELGHHLDWVLNSVDTVGDEGEYFAKFLSGELLNDAQKDSLRRQDDSTTITNTNSSIIAEGALVGNSSVTVNGAAMHIANDPTNKIQLLSVDNGYGSAWWNTPIDLSKDWSSSFYVTAFNGSGTSDGFTFAINGDSRGANAIGDGGQNLGFFGYDSKIGISNSYAILLDMWTTQPASLIGFASSNISTIAQGSSSAPISLSNNNYVVSISYLASAKILSATVGGQTFSQDIDLQATVGNKAYLGFTAANGGGTMDTDVSNWDVTASEYIIPPIIRANSVYRIVDGPTWTQAQANAVLLGGNLVSINDAYEDFFIVDKMAALVNGWGAWIGYTDMDQEGTWKWVDGSISTYTNWNMSPGWAPEPNGGYSENAAHMFVGTATGSERGKWNDSNDGQTNTGQIQVGFAEIPLSLSITRQGEVKEGAGLFTTSINLSAGTLASGNLAEGAQVWWNITGITADDLASGALVGTGVITNGKLDIQHSLNIDADAGESFEISVFSDSEETQQIGTSASAAIQEAKPIIRGNSLYTLTANGTWTTTQSIALSLGGNLATINNAAENEFIAGKTLGSQGAWIGYYQTGANSGYRWISGENSSYTNWLPGTPDSPSWEFYSYINSNILTNYGGTWADCNNEGFGNLGLGRGLAEIPLTSSITFSTTPKEGAGVFTTSINLSAGTEASGNLAEGAQVWWKIAGITADDLVSGALSGTGIITNGKLEFQNSLKVDADSGESFEVSVFSDAGLTQQIGTTSSVAVQEASPVLRGNSLYRLVEGVYWTTADSNAKTLGGYLASITSQEEDLFLWNTFATQIPITTAGLNWGYFIGLRRDQSASKDVWSNWYWDNGESTSTYRNSAFNPGVAGNEPNGNDSPYTHVWGYTPGIHESALWNDTPNFGNAGLGGTSLYGVAEISLSLSITRQGEAKEGAGVFTTSINLSAGTEASGNLAEGAQVWWNITGINADDLGSGALSGSGTIQNGKLDIQHSLKVDPDSGESFEVSVFSDASLTSEFQTGTTNSVLIIDGNNSPTDLTFTSSGINENSAAGTSVGTLSATDPDAASSFTYALVAGTGTNDADNSLVEIIGNEVKVKSGASIDFETNPTLNLNIQVTDNGTPGLTYTKAVTAAVLNVNEAPTDLIFDPIGSGINENSTAGTVVGALLGTDPDSADTFTYELIAGSGGNDADNALVEIVGNEVKVKSGASIDFETNPVLNLNIQVTDNGTPGLTYTKAVTAAVLNVNEAPVDLIFTSSGINENSAAGTLIGTLGATDPDAASSFNYALVAGNGTNDADNALVEIVGNEVKVKSGASIDFETNPTLNLNIQVTDNGTPGLTYTKAVTATVLNVNEAPVDLTFTSSGINENSAAGTSVGTLSATDPDAASSFTYALVAGSGGNDADNSLVEIVGNEVKVKSGASIDFETNPTLNLNIQVTDNGTPGLTYTKAVSAAVLDVPEDTTAPTITSISTQGTTVILKFSEAVSATSVPTTRFAVATVNSINQATNRTISTIALDQNDPTRVILTLTGTAPASTVNLRVSYTDPANNQSTAVIQDIAGNDLASFSNRFADTFITAATTTLASQYQNLTLTGNSAVSGTGNSLVNSITGNSANNTIRGLGGADKLTGLGGVDTFTYPLADSRLASFDQITDFAIGTDRIDGPSAVSAANLRELGTVSALTQAGISAVLTTSTFARNGAATFSFGTGPSARTFLALNDGTAGYTSTSDGLIEITGFTGSLTNLAVV